MKLFLRAFAECESEMSAEHLQRKLVAALAAWVSAEPAAAAKRYWKMPELFEFTFNLAPRNPETMDEIISSVPFGWDHAGEVMDRSSVWNRSPGFAFLVPEVTWAELQHYEPAPNLSPGYPGRSAT